MALRVGMNRKVLNRVEGQTVGGISRCSTDVDENHGPYELVCIVSDAVDLYTDSSSASGRTAGSFPAMRINKYYFFVA
jgi:hypothetical protein